jgi:hypothetical protein
VKLLCSDGLNKSSKGLSPNLVSCPPSSVTICISGSSDSFFTILVGIVVGLDKLIN